MNEVVDLSSTILCSMNDSLLINANAGLFDYNHVHIKHNNSIKIDDEQMLYHYQNIGYHDVMIRYHDIINYERKGGNPILHNCVMCGYDENSVIIPNQNKDVCKSCDIAYWFNIRLNIIFKFCKGCKNFVSISNFTDKLEASKCYKCRNRGRENYLTKKKLNLSNDDSDDVSVVNDKIKHGKEVVTNDIKVANNSHKDGLIKRDNCNKTTTVMLMNKMQSKNNVLQPSIKYSHPNIIQSSSPTLLKSSSSSSSSSSDYASIASTNNNTTITPTHNYTTINCNSSLNSTSNLSCTHGKRKRKVDNLTSFIPSSTPSSSTIKKLRLSNKENQVKPPLMPRVASTPSSASSSSRPISSSLSKSKSISSLPLQISQPWSASSSTSTTPLVSSIATSSKSAAISPSLSELTCLLPPYGSNKDTATEFPASLLSLSASASYLYERDNSNNLSDGSTNDFNNSNNNNDYSNKSNINFYNNNSNNNDYYYNCCNINTSGSGSMTSSPMTLISPASIGCSVDNDMDDSSMTDECFNRANYYSSASIHNNVHDGNHTDSGSSISCSYDNDRDIYDYNDINHDYLNDRSYVWDRYNDQKLINDILMKTTCNLSNVQSNDCHTIRVDYHDNNITSGNTNNYYAIDIRKVPKVDSNISNTAIDTLSNFTSSHNTTSTNTNYTTSIDSTTNNTSYNIVGNNINCGDVSAVITTASIDSCNNHNSSMIKTKFHKVYHIPCSNPTQMTHNLKPLKMKRTLSNKYNVRFDETTIINSRRYSDADISYYSGNNCNYDGDHHDGDHHDGDSDDTGCHDVGDNYGHSNYDTIGIVGAVTKRNDDDNNNYSTMLLDNSKSKIIVASTIDVDDDDDGTYNYNNSSTDSGSTTNSSYTVDNSFSSIHSTSYNYNYHDRHVNVHEGHRFNISDDQCHRDDIDDFDDDGDSTDNNDINNNNNPEENPNNISILSGDDDFRHDGKVRTIHSGSRGSIDDWQWDPCKNPLMHLAMITENNAD